MIRSFNWQSQATLAFAATVVLCIIGGFAAPSTVSSGALLGMLPFVATLAVASIGQHLVIQQRGIDLSAAGMMSLAGVLVSALPPSDANAWTTGAYVLLALLAGLAAGAVNGTIVAILKVPALITTLGTNALLQGAAILISRGHAQQVPPPLNEFGVGRFLGVPNTVYVLVAVAAVAIFTISRTTVGRRFMAVSVSPRAAAADGIGIERYQIGSYAAAGFCYAAGAVLLSGFLVTPPVFGGTPYMLATIAAVVVGGNSIAGGQRSSVVATVIGAFFLVYLGQLVVSVGFATSAQFIVQAVIVVCGAALPMVLRHSVFRRRSA